MIALLRSILYNSYQTIIQTDELISLDIQYHLTDMKRVGSIYIRETSKSKDKAAKQPLKEVDCNVRGQNRPIMKKWRMDLDNEPDSEEKSSYKDYSRPIYESDRKEITFSQPRQDSRVGKDDDVLKKMAALTKIIAQIHNLKSCGLKPNQECKLMDIQDKLLEYERKLLQNEKQNYM